MQKLYRQVYLVPFDISVINTETEFAIYQSMEIVFNINQTENSKYNTSSLYYLTDNITYLIDIII